MPDSYESMGHKETKSFMENWRRRGNLAEAVLLTESIRKKGVGEARAEEIIRKLRDWPHIHR